MSIKSIDSIENSFNNKSFDKSNKILNKLSDFKISKELIKRLSPSLKSKIESKFNFNSNKLDNGRLSKSYDQISFRGTDIPSPDENDN